MELKFQNISVSPRNCNIYYKGKYFPVISNVSGSIKSGEILAIMGPTGSGKTSLLNALACRVPNRSRTNGELYLDGELIEPKTWMKRCSLVSDTDSYFDNIYVDNIIKEVVSFRVNKADHNNINERSNYYKSRLHLHDCSGKKFVNLNQDERKRLMILLEIMSNVDVICIDEPTGEMDTMTAFDIIDTLKELAVNEQKIIILALDQPSKDIYEKIDKISLINNGSMVYYGQRTDLISKLEEYGIKNPANIEEPDFILSIFKKNTGYNGHYQNEHEIEALCNQNRVEVDSKHDVHKGNNAYVSIVPTLNETSLLFRRKVYASYSSLFMYFKYFYIKMVFLMTITMILIFFMSDRIENPIKNIPNYDKFPAEFLKDLKFQKAINYFQKTFQIFIIPSIIAFFSMYSLITAFAKQPEIIIRELSTRSYSIASFYFATLSFELLVNVIPFFLVYTFIQIGFYNICTAYTALLFITSIFILAPFVMLLGTFSFERKNLIFYSLLLSLFILIPPVLLLEQCESLELPLNLYDIPFGIIYFMFPYHFYAQFFGQFALHGILSKLEESFNNEETKDFISMVEKRLKLCKTFGTGISLPSYVFLMLALLVPFICIFINIIVLKIKFKPEIRTILSKSGKKPEEKVEGDDKDDQKNENSIIEDIPDAEKKQSPPNFTSKEENIE